MKESLNYLETIEELEGLRPATNEDKKEIEQDLVNDIPLEYDSETLMVFERDNQNYIADLKKVIDNWLLRCYYIRVVKIKIKKRGN